MTTLPTSACDSGPWQAQVAKRIDIHATALFHGMAVDGINDLDLSYTPPFGGPWDAVHVVAQDWERARAAKRMRAQRKAASQC